MNCALCLRQNALQSSHIIPEFLYKSLYDDKHRFHVLSVIPDQANLVKQKGLREPLLCADCEQKLSAWERYASLALKGGVELTYRREGNIVFIGGLDYKSFRLFQLSVLWRSSVSSLKFFEKVKLGPHEEVIRQLLLTEDPGPSKKYGCLMFGVRHRDAAFTQLIMQPGRTRVHGQQAYRFMFGGFIWAYVVSSQEFPAPHNQALLQPNGDALFLIQEAAAIEHLADFSKELLRIGRGPAM